MHLLGLATQLRTTDMEASIGFYTGMLGFRLDFRFGDFYAGLSQGPWQLHLKRVDAPDPSIAFVAAGEHLHLHIQVADADAAAAELAARGAVLASPPTDKPWGMREFTLRDDQGHTLYFASDIPKATTA